MPTTRSSRSNRPSALNAGTKRSPGKSASDIPAKRGRRSKKEREQEQTIKQSSTDIEHDEDTVAHEKSEQTEQKGEIGQNLKSRVTSSILEKGFIYFFFRGRVGVEEPQGIQDVARSYIVLRPFPLNAKLGKGLLDDSSGNVRLLVLPKKMLPKKPRDRFFAFVESVSSIKDLQQKFSSEEYATKTTGTRHVPPATPFAEGVYAITSADDRASHLAYHVTFPEIGELQKGFGVHQKGSYIVFVKNPDFPGPGLKQPPAYPKSIQEDFRGYRWIPLTPKFLDYTNTQLLVIGERIGIMREDQAESDDERDDEKLAQKEEVDKWINEVAHLGQHDPIFADLYASSQEHRKMQSTW